jgi:hypothetical protein
MEWCTSSTAKLPGLRGMAPWSLGDRLALMDSRRGFSLVHHFGDGWWEVVEGFPDNADKALSLDCAGESAFAVISSQGPPCLASCICTSLVLILVAPVYNIV